jgi:hypothetical protein
MGMLCQHLVYSVNRMECVVLVPVTLVIELHGVTPGWEANHFWKGWRVQLG